MTEGSSEAVVEGPRPVALASYELLGKLARGGMGTVYVARRAGAAGFQRLFAVKLMHDHLADHEEFVQMFLDEARLAARLHHPNVVAILDTGEIEGRQFVVMDYIEGCSLQQLLSLSPDNRPLRSIVSIFNDFLLGLHAAHELRGDDGSMLNLVHRDVSPQNVLVGIDGVARITDFGIAKAEARLTSTRPGLRKGKLAFMAPEQLYDEGIDRRADLFSAGAMLWSTLTGEKLFAGSSDAATMRNLLQMDVQPPSEVGLKPPSVFDAICLKALAKSADDRFQSAAEFADALRAAAMDNDMLGTSSDVASWMRAVAGQGIDERRRALGQASTESSVNSMPILVESSSSVGSIERSIQPSVSMERKKRKKAAGMMLWLMVALPLAVVVAVVAAVFTTQKKAETDPAPAPVTAPVEPQGTGAAPSIEPTQAAGADAPSLAEGDQKVAPEPVVPADETFPGETPAEPVEAPAATRGRGLQDAERLTPTAGPRAGRVWGRGTARPDPRARRGRRPTAPEGPAPTPSSTTNMAPADTPAPPSTPSRPRIEIEDNPYTR